MCDRVHSAVASLAYDRLVRPALHCFPLQTEVPDSGASSIDSFFNGIDGFVLGFMSAAAVRADEWNKQTVLTFSQPVELPGRVLPAGTSMFKLRHPGRSAHRAGVQCRRIATHRDPDDDP